MKKFFTLIICFVIISLSVSAQDTLRIDFKSNAAQLTETNWEKIVITDKTLPSDIYNSYSVFNGLVKVKPVWLNTPIANNIRAVNRTSNNYKGALPLVINNYVAADARQATDCNIIAIKLTGLPVGTYTWKSYHHDTDDQHGTFTVKIENKAGTIIDDTTKMLITHSKYIGTFAEGRVINSIDSVCQYKYTSITSAGVEDTITVSFKNILAPDVNMVDQSIKFTLINGFILSKNTDITKVQKLDYDNISIINEADGKVSVKGTGIANVKIYSINGILVKSISNKGDRIELGDLQNGIYLVKVGCVNGKIVCKKIMVH